MKRLTMKQVEDLVYVKNMSPRVKPKRDPYRSMEANGLISSNSVSGRYYLTDKGFDAIKTYHVLDEDEPRPRWEITFEAYLRTFSEKGLRKLMEDAKHDMKWYLADPRVKEGEGPKIGGKTFEACPLSYSKGGRGSFQPYAGEIQHTENAFVEYWDDLLRGNLQSPMFPSEGRFTIIDVLGRMCELMREEFKRRKLSEFKP